MDDLFTVFVLVQLAFCVARLRIVDPGLTTTGKYNHMTKWINSIFMFLLLDCLIAFSYNLFDVLKGLS